MPRPGRGRQAPVSRPYAVLDVFTETPLAGNGLAVVLEAEGLDTARMQAIARGFNLSETVFVLPPRDPVNTARLRIFTPARELPFAGHPTVGTAVLLASRRAPEIVARQDLVVVLEEEVGPVTCTVRRGPNGVLWASFALPRLPELLTDPLDAAAAAAALGLDPAAIGFGAHVPCFATAGTPFAFVPVADREAAGRARPVEGSRAAVFGGHGVYLYTTDTADQRADLHARMFAPRLGLAEDPATGSAAAALAAVLMRFERPEDGDHTVLIEQGLEMGRPSLITLGMEVEGGRLQGGSIAGAAVLVADGTLRL